jgi:hypothetical protein
MPYTYISNDQKMSYLYTYFIIFQSVMTFSFNQLQVLNRHFHITHISYHSLDVRVKFKVPHSNAHPMRPGLHTSPVPIPIPPHLLRLLAPITILLPFIQSSSSIRTTRPTGPARPSTRSPAHAPSAEAAEKIPKVPRCSRQCGVGGTQEPRHLGCGFAVLVVQLVLGEGYLRGSVHAYAD